MLAIAAICAGPLVGVAAAAPVLVQASPADGAVITDPAHLPADVEATYNEALYPPSSPVVPSTVSMTLNGAFFGCTADISADQKTLKCTPFAGSHFTDGVYNVTFTAKPYPTTGETAVTTTHVQFTIDTTAPTLDTETPAPDSRVKQPAAVVATYKENLQTAPASASTLTVTDSQGNVLGGSSAVTNPTSKTGAVTWTPAGPLPSGVVFTATAHVTDLHGLTTTSSWQFTVDDVPPAAPTLVAPTWVNIANQHHVPITGTADTTTGGASKVRVTVSDGSTSKTLPDVPVGNDGSWSAASVADLSTLTGPALTVTAAAIDVAGNISSDSTAAHPTKDTAAPTPVPTVNFPAGVTTVNAANPTLDVSGITEPDAGIAVTATDESDHTTSPATTVAAHSDGAYDAVVDSTALGDGVLTIAVTATDAAGNTSTATKTISKDATPPGTPTITVFDPVNFANNSVAHTVSGTAPNAAGTTVNVWVTDSANTPPPTVTGVPVDGAGHWTTTIPLSGLASGPITAHATSFDAASNPSSADGTKVTIKDVLVPAAPTYAAPDWINNAAKSAVPLSGTAEPFTTVHLVATDSGAGSNVSDVPVLGDGTWSTALDLHSFAEGAVAFEATVIDAAGNVSDPVDDSSTKDTIAPAQPAAPGLSAPAANTGVVTATGAGTNLDNVVVTLTSDGGAGQASGNGDVTGGAYEAPVDASALPDGTLTGVAVETDRAGNASAPSNAATVIKDTTSPLVVASTVPADGASVKSTPTLSATYNQQLDLAQSTVTLKDSVGSVLGHTTATLSADKKTISVSPSNNPLSEASGYQAIFTVKDLSDTDAATTTVTFTVDRTAPAAPAVSSVAAVFSGNVGAVPGSGTATEPAGTVAVTLTDGTHEATGTSPVAGDGTWSAPLNASGLSDGPITATATQTDAAGNTSVASASAPAGKDTVAPAKPTLVWSGNVTEHAQTVVLNGTAEPGSTVNLSVDDGNAATTPVHDSATAANTDGTWSKQLSLAMLDDGALTATAWATDTYGNVGLSIVVAGVKDTVAPTVRLTAPRSAFSLGAVTAAWRASDAGSGLTAAPYDVQWARAAHGKALGGYQLLATELHPSSITRTLRPGTTACFEVRAHDAVGNVSGWSAPRCRTIALDDKAMTASAGWTRIRDRRLFHGSAFTSTAKGATLRLAASRLNRVAIVATHCPTCGSIAIFVGGQRIKVIDLHSSATHRRVLTTLAALTARTATVTIRVLGNGKPVVIDGVGTARY